MKVCVLCGREIEPRKKWSRNWDEVKYCSDRCRSQKRVKDDFEISILETLKVQGSGKTICPSELLPKESKSDKVLMERVRQAARRLVAQGKIVITQNGSIVDPSRAKGPIRLKLTEKE